MLHREAGTTNAQPECSHTSPPALYAQPETQDAHPRVTVFLTLAPPPRDAPRDASWHARLHRVCLLGTKSAKP